MWERNVQEAVITSICPRNVDRESKYVRTKVLLLISEKTRKPRNHPMKIHIVVEMDWMT